MSDWEHLRPGFEAWIKHRPFFAKAKMHLKVAADGSYCDYRVNDRWAAWKAAYVKFVGDQAALATGKIPVAEVEKIISNWRYLIKHEREHCGRTYSHIANRLEHDADELEELVKRYK